MKRKPSQTIEINEQFKKALEIMESTFRNVFITGKAGTGKSTLLDYFRNTTAKKIVVLAPTGVAAVNVRGQTIHSFFKFKPGITPGTVKRNRAATAAGEIYRELDAVVIDEISMVRADLLDCVDKFMRLYGRRKNEPFGGAQIIFFGDLYQLPPVVMSQEKEIFRQEYGSEYFFDALVLKHGNFRFDLIELEKIYRQKDEKFIALLNAIRNNSITAPELEQINACCCRQLPDGPEEDFYICLTPTNKASEIINAERLTGLPGEPHIFTGHVNGEFKNEYLPTGVELKLKSGAQVMLLNNDPLRRWVNGTVGQVARVVDDPDGGPAEIFVELADGDTVAVTPFTWEIYNFTYDREMGAIVNETVGSFTQYPLKLAWSVTIHKSQGKTFDRVIIDIGRGTFAHGQMYVALSRCTALSGIILKKPIIKNHILMDWRVVKFVTTHQYGLSEKNLPVTDKINLINEAIAGGKTLEITYLKANDIKSKRLIEPKEVGEMEYAGKKFLGLSGYCQSRHEERVFRVDRILEMNIVKK